MKVLVFLAFNLSVLVRFSYLRRETLIRTGLGMIWPRSSGTGLGGKCWNENHLKHMIILMKVGRTFFWPLNTTVAFVWAHPCWWDSWWDSHLVRRVDSWWDGLTLGEMAGLLVIFSDSWWDLWTLGEIFGLLVKLIITKIITFNTDSGYNTEIK